MDLVWLVEEAEVAAKDRRIGRSYHVRQQVQECPMLSSSSSDDNDYCQLTRHTTFAKDDD